jgi:uncharacterized protein with NRDE domain
MCIALVTTSHPKYALIVLDNRDEYVLRPTSRPHWWTHHPSGSQILSSRDLLRRERGTWMGITNQGRLAVLTNYRETVDESEQSVYGVRSRGGMKGVGGFSLSCGALKRRGKEGIQPMVIISNRSEAADRVPRIGGERDRVWGLSNTVYEDPPRWPKIKLGKQLLEETIQKAVEKGASEDELTNLLFSMLDSDTMPLRSPGMKHEEYLDGLQHTVFVPAVSDQNRRKDMDEAIANGKMKAAFDEIEDESREIQEQDPPVAPTVFEKGEYGTQRQTIILVDWDGNVTYKERALWDAHGNLVERGQGDSTTKFAIQGWS